MNKILCLGGPQDAQIKETDVAISPLLAEPAKIPVVCENGLVKNYLVVFLSGIKIQFPIAVWEDLTPDDVFKLLLNWYAIKPHVQRIEVPSEN